MGRTIWLAAAKFASSLIGGRAGVRVATGVFATTVLVMGCTRPTVVLRVADGTADFAGLRLQGAFRCDTAVDCQMTFTQGEARLVVDDGAFVNRLIYDVAYSGTHTQSQNVSSGSDCRGAGACGSS